MSTISRQNALFVAEDWSAIYEALNYVDFRAYSFETLVQSIVDYCKINYPDDFNDWIASSEFIMHVETLAWLSQNLAFRIDLNTRENFLPTAERRNSILRLASLIAYKANRVQGLDGFIQLNSISTTQPYTDVNGTNLQNRIINWNDQQNEDWYDQFITILNLAFINRTQFGNPFVGTTIDSERTEQYVFNSYAPATGVYPFESSINGVTLNMEVYNGTLSAVDGTVTEVAPNVQNALNVFYKSDGLGYGSSGTGFFFPLKQGTMAFQTVNFPDPVSLQVVDINVSNIDNSDIWIQQVDASGNVISQWNEVDTVFGEGVAFNTLDTPITSTNNPQQIFEVDTLINDQVRIRFGDGSFGQIPQGNFIIWYRTVNPVPLVAMPTDIQNVSVTIPYAYGNQIYYLSMNLSLTNNINNGSFSETNMDIKTRAGKFFYTQNRMVTGQDYTNYFLNDNSIRKVKTINRTFSGASRYAKLHDPTSLYENVKQYAEDGRLYQDVTTSVALVDGNPSTMPLSYLISNYISPLLVKEDKNFLYVTEYPEIMMDSYNYTWNNDSVVSGTSRGRVLLYNNTQAVGSTLANTSPLFYVMADSIIRFSDRLGDTATVDRVVNNGSALNGIWLKQDVIPAAAPLYSIVPPLRTTFLVNEISTITNALSQLLTFGLSWNQTTLSWNIINNKNINISGEFSLQYQGDTTNTNADCSWLIMCEYSSNNGNPQWSITDRGISLFFESAQEVEFIFVNDALVNNTSISSAVQDQVTILEINESRDSARRRGIVPQTVGGCPPIILNGVLSTGTTVIPTNYIDLDVTKVLVYIDDQLMVPNVEYVINPLNTGNQIQFIIALPANCSYEVWLSSDMALATPQATRLVGDDNTAIYTFGASGVSSANTFSFWDGIYQNMLDDYYVYDDTVTTSLIAFKENIPLNTVCVINYFSGTISPSFIRNNFIGDGVTQVFTVATETVLLPIPLISLDGVIQTTSDYTLSMSETNLVITFGTAPAIGVHFRIIVPRSYRTARVALQSFVTDGATNSFTLNYSNLVPEQIIVSLDGVTQVGQYYTNYDWTLIGNKLVFRNTPLTNMNLNVYIILAVAGQAYKSPLNLKSFSSGNIGDNSTVSCYISYLDSPYSLTPVDMIRYEDGYTNTNGLIVKPSDLNMDGIYDKPNTFRDLVIQDGVTDLVLWTKTQQYGFDLWQPIDRLTPIKGTYGATTSVLPVSGFADPMNDVYPTVGSLFDPNVTNIGDINFNTSSKQWLIADGISQAWILAPDQTIYKFRIGRDHLKFVWTHVAIDETIIDPCPTNIMNAYILTQNFLNVYNAWLQSNQAGIEPVAETSAQLKLEYQNYGNFKMMSDSLVFYPARFKKLFGTNALPQNQVLFKVIQSPGSSMSENDLKLNILNLIDSYFDVSNWDFGETFYFTELAAYVHQKLAPNIQAIVPVPYLSNYSFGNAFQIRAEPDELFVSTATVDTIQLISTFTDEDLKIVSLL